MAFSLLNMDDQGYDAVMLFKIKSNESLRLKILKDIDICNFLDKMSFDEETKHKYNKMKEEFGQYFTVKSFFMYAMDLVVGWAKKFMDCLEEFGYQYIFEKLDLTEQDCAEYESKLGIPVKSVLEHLSMKSQEKASELLTSMGQVASGPLNSPPIVHPQLCLIRSQDMEREAFFDHTYEPGAERRPYSGADAVMIEDVHGSNHRDGSTPNAPGNRHGENLLLVGKAGCGSTWSSQQLLKLNTSRLYTTIIPFVNLHDSVKWSLMELLVQVPILIWDEGTLKDDEIVENYKWIEHNQDKFVLIFEGYHWSSFRVSLSNAEVPEEPQELQEEKLPPSQLLQLLISRKFLPNIRIIITSRPSALPEFNEQVRPSSIVFMNGFTDEDRDAVMRYFLGEIHEPMMESLKRNHELAMRSLENPMFLRLFIESFTTLPSAEVTSYKLLSVLLERYIQSATFESTRDNDNNIAYFKRLEELAYKATVSETFLLPHQNEEDGAYLTGFLFTAGDHYYFAQPAVQDFLAARYAIEQLELEEFGEFCSKCLFPALDVVGDTIQINSADTFLAVRRLVFGCLYGQDERGRIEKRAHYSSVLGSHLQTLFSSGATVADRVSQHQLNILKDFNQLGERIDAFTGELRELTQSLSVSVHVDGSNALAWCGFLNNFSPEAAHVHSELDSDNLLDFICSLKIPVLAMSLVSAEQLSEELMEALSANQNELNLFASSQDVFEQFGTYFRGTRTAQELNAEDAAGLTFDLTFGGHQLQVKVKLVPS